MATKMLDGLINAFTSIDWAKYSKPISDTLAAIFIAASENTTEFVAAVTPALVKMAIGVVDGLIQGLLQWITSNPADFAGTLALAFAGKVLIPAKWIGAMIKGLDNIPIVGTLVSFFLGAIDNLLGLVTNPLHTKLYKLADGMIGGFKNGLKSLWNTLYENVIVVLELFFKPAVTWLVGHGKNIFGGLINGLRSMGGALWNGIADVASNVGRFFANAGSWLWDAGRSIINGLINGIKSMFGNVKSTLGDLTKKIGEWKGPMSVDKVLLTKQGEAVIQGFINGMESQYSSVKSSLAGLTGSLYGDQSMMIDTQYSSLPSISSQDIVPAGGSQIVNNIENISIDSEVDGENWLRKLTRDEEVTSAGLTNAV